MGITPLIVNQVPVVHNIDYFKLHNYAAGLLCYTKVGFQIIET